MSILDSSRRALRGTRRIATAEFRDNGITRIALRKTGIEASLKVSGSPSLSATTPSATGPKALAMVMMPMSAPKAVPLRPAPTRADSTRFCAGVAAEIDAPNTSKESGSIHTPPRYVDAIRKNPVESEAVNSNRIAPYLSARLPMKRLAITAPKKRRPVEYALSVGSSATPCAM